MLKLALNRDKRIIPDTAAFFSDLAVTAGVNPAKKNSICRLLETALAKRVENLPSDEEILVEAGISKDSFVISLTDKGLPYSLPDEQKALIKKEKIDHFTLLQLGKDGMKFEFSCKLESVPEYMEEPEFSEDLLDKDITFRLISDKDEDILKSIRCIYSQYRYNYPHTALYNIENFRLLLKSDKYLSAIGENRHAQVVSHIALNYHDFLPGLPEFGSLVTRPIARGCGIAGKSLTFIEKVAEKRGDDGIFCLAIGLHPYTQKICTKDGYSPCGVYFDYVPPEASGNLNDGITRFACFFAVKIINRSRCHKVYIPAALTKFVTKVFDNQKTPFTVDEKLHEPENKPTRYSYSYETSDGNFEAYISSIGSDIAEVLTIMKNLDELRTARNAVAYLNCSETGFIKTFELLKANGFCFTGFLPGSTEGDFVIMQKFRTPPNLTTNVVAPDYQEMCHAVREANGL